MPLTWRSFPEFRLPNDGSSIGLTHRFQCAIPWPNSFWKRVFDRVAQSSRSVSRYMLYQACIRAAYNREPCEYPLGALRCSLSQFPVDDF